MQKGVSRRSFLAVVGSTATAGLTGCLGLFEREPFDIGMTATAFNPPTFSVPVGTTVVWRNTSTRGHTVTAYEGGIPDAAEYFASGGYEDEESAREAWESDFGGALETGDRFSHTFEVAGRYDYVCIPHETGGMYATVYVEE